MTLSKIFFRSQVILPIFLVTGVMGPLSGGGWLYAEDPAPRLPVVILDAGHGGKDPGAIGIKKIKEKEIVLSLAKKVAAELKTTADVFLTRSQDRFVSLEGRNRFANRRTCDLFLSIHANASPTRSAHGIEIYYLNNATDQAARRLARRENEGAPKKEKELEAIVSQLILNAATEESAEAAATLRRSIRAGLKIDPQIRTALFYVLVGAKCPSLLIESGFVTNRSESQRLKNPRYQAQLARAIAQGVRSFFQAAPREDL